MIIYNIRNQKMLYLLLCILTFDLITAQKSICFDVLKYKPSNDTHEWEGVINLIPLHDTLGVVLKIKMTHKIELFLNWFGHTTTKDNQIYFIENLEVKIKKHDIYFVPFKIRFNETKEIPQVKQIHFNGKLICPQSSRSNKTNIKLLDVRILN